MSRLLPRSGGLPTAVSHGRFGKRLSLIAAWRAAQFPVQIHIGCSGWFYWHWRGIFYPDTKRTDGWFHHYTTVFSTVELNAPFYSWPKPATVKAWRRNAPVEFRYSVKVNSLITHDKRMV